MSSFGTGSALTSGASINLTPYKGTDGNNAGTDGLVPGPAALQAGHILGASGDWTLNVKEVNDENGQIDVNESSNRIATTKFVQTLIGNAQLGGGNANLSALGDTQFANLGADQFLQYNGNKWVNVDFTLDTISNVNLVGLAVGNTIVWDGAEWVPGVGGGGGANNLDGLTDVEINGGDVNHFLVRDGNGKYVNRVISTSDLDNGDKVVLIDAPATFGAHAYDFTVSTVSVKAPQADAHAATKKYVDDEINGIDLTTKQDADASLDTITGIGNKDLLLGDGVDSFEKVTVSAGVEVFLRGAGSIDNLTDVDTSTQAPQNGQVLKWDGNNFIPQDDVDTNTQLSSNEVKDIVGDMLDGTETGISVSYDGVNRNLDFIVSLAGFSVDALSDVDTTTDAPQNGEVLKWDGNNFVPSADTGKTDAEIKDIVGGMVEGNTETGISVTYDAVDRNLDFAVSLGGFSVRELSDVSNDALVNGKILKVVNGVLTQVDETDTNTQLTDNQVKDIVGTMVAGNTETGISVTYDAVDRNLDFVVASISSSDLTDGGVNGNISLLDANQTLSGNKTFTGTVSLGANATATTQNASNNSTSVATTAYVDAQIDADIVALNLGATYQAKDASLDDITGIVDGDLLLGNGPDSFEKVNVSAGVETILKGTGSVGTLSDITLQAGAVGDVLRVSAVDVNNVPTSFVNTELSSGDLSDTTNISLLSANQTMSGNKIFTGTATFRDDITATTEGKFISVNTPTADAHVSTKKYVDDELTTGLATKQPLEATLTGLANIDPGDNDLIIATGDNTFGVINTSAGVQTFLASDGSLDGLDNVTIAGNLGNALADGQTLRYDGANQIWKNSKLAFVDLDSNAASTQNVALLNGNQTFTGTIVFTNDITATTQGKYISANTPTQDSHVATKKYVDDEMEVAGLVSSLTTLTDVTIGADNGNGVAEQVGQVLKIASIVNGDATYRNAQLAYTELSGTPVVGADIQAYNVALASLATMGTGANKIIYSTAEDSFAESDITDYTRSLLAEANEGAVKAYLNLESGTDIQAQNATLQGISDIGGVADGKIIYTDGGADTFATSDISAFALTILDDATDADVRTTLGLGTASTSDIGDFLASTSGLNALSDVTVANPSDAQILIYDGDQVGNDNDQFKNVSISGVISVDNAGVVSFATDAIDENNIATAIKDGVITNTYLASPFVNLTDGNNVDKLNLGETITFAGTADEIEVSTTADAQGNNAGATVTVGLPQNVTIGNNLTVNGNLTVSGTTTTVDTTNMVIEDRVISLNSGVENANTNDIGLFFDRGTEDPALFIWDESVDKFKVGTENGATASQAGDYALTLKKMEVETPANDSNSTEVATTEWVRDFNTNQGNASDLDGLTDVGIGDVALADAHILIYDNVNEEFRNKAISGDISISNTGATTIGALKVQTGMIANNAITIDQLAEPSVSSAQLYADAVTTAKILNANITTAKLADSSVTTLKLDNDSVTTAKILNGNVTTAKLADSSVEASKLAIDSVTTAKILNNNVTNEKLQSSSLTVGTTSISLGGSSTTLSGMTGVDFAVGNASIASSIGNSTLTIGGVNTTVDVAGVLTVNAPTAGEHAATKSYVDTKQPIDATLSALSLLETGEKKLIYSTANDALEMISLSDNAKTFIASSAGLTNLDGVTIGDIALAEKHFLVQDNLGQFVNRLITTSDLSNGDNIALLDADQTFTGTVLVTTQGAGNDTTRIANTAFVQQEITALDLANTYQGKDDTLSALAIVGTASDKLIYATDVDTFSTTTFTGKARELLDDATFADMRTTLGLAIGANVQAYNSDLAGIASIGGVVTGKIIYTKTVDNNVVWDEATFTDYAKGLVALGGEAQVKSYLNLEIGTDVQAQNARLADISALDVTADNFIVGDGANLVLKTPTNAISSLGMGVGEHDLLIGSGVNTFTTIATTESVRSFLASGSVGTLSDVTLQAGAVGDVLRVSSVDVNNVPNGFTSTTLSYNDLSNTPSLGTSSSKDAGTGADEVLLLADANTLPALDGTALTGVLLEASNLSDLGDAGSARENLGLGNVATLDTTETGGNNDAGKPIVTDAQGKLGALDGANLTALGSVALHSNVDLTDISDGQGLIYNNESGNLEPGTVPTVGTNVDQTPSISAQAISLNPNSLVGGDLVIYGRFVETIDYGTDMANNQGVDLFDQNSDFAIDFGSVTDTVIYSTEDYGVLVV